MEQVLVAAGIGAIAAYDAPRNLLVLA